MPRFITSYYWYGLVIYWVFISFYICGDYKPACNTHVPHVSISYVFQENQQNSSIQLPVVEQFSFSSSYHGYASSAYKQALYCRSGSVTIANHQYPVTREDYDLIVQIILDNPHYEKYVLWNLLLQSSIINQAAMLLKEDKQLHFQDLAKYTNTAY